MKAVYDIIDSSADTIGTVTTVYDNVKLHRPTMRSQLSPVSLQSTTWCGIRGMPAVPAVPAVVSVVLPGVAPAVVGPCPCNQGLTTVFCYQRSSSPKTLHMVSINQPPPFEAPLGSMNVNKWIRPCL